VLILDFGCGAQVTAPVQSVGPIRIIYRSDRTVILPDHGYSLLPQIRLQSCANDAWLPIALRGAREGKVIACKFRAKTGVPLPVRVKQRILSQLICPGGFWRWECAALRTCRIDATR
jgi:hypothetical protein